MMRNRHCFFVAVKKDRFEGYRTFCVFFNVNEVSVYRALLAQQGGVAPGAKSSCLEIRRISLLKATRSAFNIEKVLSVFEPAFLFCYN